MSRGLLPISCFGTLGCHAVPQDELIYPLAALNTAQ